MVDQEARRDVEQSIAGAVEQVVRRHPIQTAQKFEPLWYRQGKGWSMRNVAMPVIHPGWFQQVPWEQEAQPIEEALRRHYPKYLELVGTSATGATRGSASGVLISVLKEMWQRSQSTGASRESVLDELIRECSQFYASDTVRLRYAVPLYGFDMDDRQTIVLSEDFRLEHLSEVQFNTIFNDVYMAGRLEVLWAPQFAFIGEWDEPKVVGDDKYERPGSVSARVSELMDRLGRAVVALRAFKRGGLGFSERLVRAAMFTPVPISSLASGGDSGDWPAVAAIGGYQLRRNELTAFLDHYALVTQCPLHSTMELAISRLSMAETRHGNIDRVIDAAIGLEAILLSEQGDPPYRGESRFRFALHYAVLGRTPDEKRSRFFAARDLYDLRSGIAHGGNVAKNRFGNMLHTTTGQRAVEMLREVVRQFLPEVERPLYVRDGFWQSKYFGESADPLPAAQT